MADLTGFDYNRDAEPQESYDPIPSGEYVAQVVDSDIKDTKNGTGKYIKLTWEIIDGEYTGRKLFENYNIINSNPQAVEIGERQWAAVQAACGKYAVTDTEEVHAIPCFVKVGIRPAQGNYGPQNSIKGYKPAVAGQQQVAPAQAAPVQRPAPTQQRPPAAPSNQGKPVWMQK
jgi:hypothetical protein